MDPLRLITPEEKTDGPLILSTDEAYARERLLRQAAGMARRLEEIGCQNRRVIVSLDSGPLFFSGLVGCWLAGATPVLLDPLVKQEMLGAVAMTDARAVIHRGSGAITVPEGVTWISPDGREEDSRTAPPVDDDDPVLFLFTSGSTGRPALVPKRFAALDVEVQFLSDLFGCPRRVATLVPWCHIFGLIVSFLLPSRLGGVCDLSAGISPRIVLERAGAGLLDLVVAVPAVYQVMVRYLEAGDLGPLKTSCRFVTSGAPMTPALRSRFKALTGHPITDLYGSTEAGGVAYRHDDGPWTVQPHVETRVDKDGYLEVRSASVSVGPPGQFYRIGDLVVPEGEGFGLVGRQDDVVKIGGRRTALSEIQEVVEACSGVARAVVLAEKVRGKVRVVAYVQRDDTQLDEGGIKSFVRDRLADHKVPRRITFVAEIPLTPAGKVARQQLKALGPEVQ